MHCLAKITGLAGLPHFIIFSFDGNQIIPVIIDKKIYMHLSVGLSILYKLMKLGGGSRDPCGCSPLEFLPSSPTLLRKKKKRLKKERKKLTRLDFPFMQIVQDPLMNMNECRGHRSGGC